MDFIGQDKLIVKQTYRTGQIDSKANFLSAKCLIQHLIFIQLLKVRKLKPAALPTITPAKALLSLCINVNNMVCTVYCPPPSVHRKLNNIEL